MKNRLRLFASAPFTLLLSHVYLSPGLSQEDDLEDSQDGCEQFFSVKPAQFS